MIDHHRVMHLNALEGLSYPKEIKSLGGWPNEGKRIWHGHITNVD